MPLYAKRERKPVDLIPADTYRAVCYAVIDIGSHYNKAYDKVTRQVLIIWELPDLLMNVQKDGVTKQMPRVISKKYTLSLNEKANLLKDLQSWRGKVFSEQELEGFDLKNVLGANCMIQIIHAQVGEATYANIANILPLFKQIPHSQSINPLVYYSLDDIEEIPETVPSWIKELIITSDEYKAKYGLSQQEATPATHDDDVPF